MSDRDPDTKLVEAAPWGRAPRASPALTRGTVIARYVLLEAIAGGGMGVVYKAYDPELARVVAIKLLRTDRSSRSSGETLDRRLQREAQALARVSHPNVIAVHDVGVWNDNVFIAMDYVEGMTLSEWQRQQRRSAAEIAAVFIAAGQGLAAAHRAGIVHRDFKPSNVIVGDDQIVRVLDFGLARSTDSVQQINTTDSDAGSQALTPTPPPRRSLRRATERDTKLDGPAAGPATTDDAVAPSSDVATEPAAEPLQLRVDEPSQSSPMLLQFPVTARMSTSSEGGGSILTAPLTVAGTVMGTPGYMAPEQQRGESTDARTDQFSFCVALFEAFAGARPFGEAAFARGRKTPQLTMNKKIPLRLRRVLARGLKEDPGERYDSMDDLLRALQRASRRRQWPWVAAAFVVLTGGPAWTVYVQGQGPAPCEAVEEQMQGIWDEGMRGTVERSFLGTRRKHADEAFAAFANVVDQFATRWTTAWVDACEDTHVRQEQSDTLLDLRMACLKRERHKLEALMSLLNESDDVSVFDNATQAVMEFDNVASCSNTDALLEADPLPTDPVQREQVSGLLRDLDRAEVMQEAGNYAPALELARGIVERSQVLDYPRLRANALFRQGSLLHDMGRWKDAELMIRDALMWSARTRDHTLAANAWLILLDNIGYRQARQNEALHLELPTKLAVHAAGDLPRTLARMLSVIATLARERSDLAAARGALEQAHRVLEDAGESASNDGLAILNALGVVLMRQGELGRAADHLRSAAALLEQRLGSHHPKITAPLTNLAGVELRRGNDAEAEAIYRRILSIDEAALGSAHSWVGEDLNNLGKALITGRKFDEAKPTLERALQVSEKAVGPDHPVVATILLNLGTLAVEQARYQDAGKAFERSLPILTRVGNNQLPELHIQRGRMYAGLERFAEAREAFELARQHYAKSGVVDTAVGAELYERIGEAELAADRVDEACAAFERSIGLLGLQKEGAANRRRADVRLKLADAAWRRRDHARAITVAIEARADLEQVDADVQLQRRRVDEWLRTHRP